MAEAEKVQPSTTAPAKQSGPKKVKVELLAELWRQPVGGKKQPRRRTKGDVFELSEAFVNSINNSSHKHVFKVLDN